MKYTIAFVGNPNVGKSAWINALSNADFKVGNWPGVSIACKEADVEWEGNHYHLIDLPGTYSLEAGENEEGITYNYLHETAVDLIVNVVDATNLSRNLLLTLFLRDLQIPMILIFNFMDQVEKYKIQVDVTKMSRRLQTTILPYSAMDKEHYDIVKQAIIKHAGSSVFYYPLYRSEDVERYVSLYNYLETHLPIEHDEHMLHTLCTKFLNEDPLVLRQFVSWHMDIEHLHMLQGELGKEVLMLHRYDIVASLMKYVQEDTSLRYANSCKIDELLLHKVVGYPIFFLLFSILLLFVFQASAPFTDVVDFLINDMLYKYMSSALFWAPQILRELVLHGILAGVGGVLIFVPLMAFLYVVLSVLEESGYMARIAFLLDRLMHTFHLSGKSFVALLLGFGCNVPAIYATRTLDNEKQKRLTALLVPFMSCGARLPVYVLFAAAFFPQKAGFMILSVYGIGIFMALLLALLFSRTPSFHDEDMFVLELPPYRLPSLRVVLHKARKEVGAYVKKATGIVLWAMIILWSLSYFPSGRLEESYIAQGSKALMPIFEPLGFGNRWESIASLPGGIIAKETIVGFFDQVLVPTKTRVVDELEPLQDLQMIGMRFIDAVKQSATSMIAPHITLKPQSDGQVKQMSQLWTDRYAPLRAFSFMVYVLLSIPCIMTLQALYHEYGKNLLLLSLASMIVLPYLVSLFIFQFFSLFY